LARFLFHSIRDEEDMLSVGDTFIYSGHGILELTDIREMNEDNETRLYYVLKPVLGNSFTLYVPVGNENLEAKMRRLLNADEVHKFIGEMPGKDSVWIEDENERRQFYKEALSNGDRDSLVRLIKSVFLRKRELNAAGRKLHTTDEQFMKDAEKILYDEFAYVLGIKREDVMPFILSQLEEGGQNHG
jgi:CarD family transcriptional regulator